MSFISLSSIPNFDPRKVPVVGVDAHLPAVGAHMLNPAALRARFVQPPPWSPEVREEPRFTDRTPVRAAVLVAIVAHPDAPTVVLTQRTTNLATHSGQIAFAGGKVDAMDANEQATALREAHEEIGLDPSLCQVLGALPHYVTGTAFTITPVVALVQPGFKLQANPDEVADMFEVPLDFLMNPANHARHQVNWNNVQREWFSMTWQDAPHTPERFIWGATAGMLRNLYRFLIAK